VHTPRSALSAGRTLEECVRANPFLIAIDFCAFDAVRSTS
jgi:hypothetical protein